MDYIASLDMGSETMVMALAEVYPRLVRVIAVEQMPSKGIERGRVRDRESAKDTVSQLLAIFSKEHGMKIDVLRISIPATWLQRVVVHKSFSSMRITKDLLQNLEKECRKMLPDDGPEPVTILSVSRTTCPWKAR